MSRPVRIGIIGTGAAISTLHSGIAQELLLDDIRTTVAVAEGETTAASAQAVASACSSLGSL